MKKNLLTIISVTVLAGLITGCASLSPGEKPTRTMNVSGTGRVDLQPDIARVNIGVRSQSAEVVDAFERNNADAESVIQTLVDMGIDRSDIQTRNFSIYQQQDQVRPMVEGENGGQETQTTYVVENTVSVTVRQLDTLGEVLSAVIAEGANTIHGVAFDIEDRDEAEAEARQLAIQDAQEKAQAIAEEAGVSLGQIRTINISQGGGVPIERAAAMEQPQGGSVPISGGSLTVQVTANLSYEIEN